MNQNLFYVILLCLKVSSTCILIWPHHAFQSHLRQLWYWQVCGYCQGLKMEFKWYLPHWKKPKWWSSSYWASDACLKLLYAADIKKDCMDLFERPRIADMKVKDYLILATLGEAHSSSFVKALLSPRHWKRNGLFCTVRLLSCRSCWV